MKTLKELYRIGVGPSSSHTMAPRAAAERFEAQHPTAAKFRVVLYGSLAATGKGHLTDVAIHQVIPKRPVEIIWRPGEELPLHTNGMHFEAFDAEGNCLGTLEEYSMGGGALLSDHVETTEAYPEKNMEEIPGLPLNKKESIEKYYQLVKQAGDRMPKSIMENNWLWRMYMQKGALDYYTKLAVTQQLDLQTKIENHLKQTDSEQNISTALSWFSKLEETVKMKDLRVEAEKLGEESNGIYGVRNDGIFNLEHDFIGLAWLKRQLQRAQKASEKERQELLTQITDYENPGHSGFYDNLGTANCAPNVVKGYPYDHGQPYVPQMLDEGNRHSQRSMHFTQDELKGVTLHYPELDPTASYKIRFSFVRPWFQERYSMRMNQKSQAIYADDILLSEGVELPLQMSDFFTFDIPPAATKDGQLNIRLKKADDVANGDRVTVEQWRNSGGWGTLVSEVWLIKQD